MHQILLAQGLALSLLLLGCFNGTERPEANGKAVITVDGEELVLDTGDNGKEIVPRDDGEWNVDCFLYDGATQFALADHRKNRDGFHYLALHLIDSARGGDAAFVNMRMYVGGDLLAGSCPAAHRRSHMDPHESDFSFAACDLRRLDEGTGALPARLELAAFHLKSCVTPRDD